MRTVSASRTAIALAPNLLGGDGAPDADVADAGRFDGGAVEGVSSVEQDWRDFVPAEAGVGTVVRMQDGDVVAREWFRCWFEAEAADAFLTEKSVVTGNDCAAGFKFA